MQITYTAFRKIKLADLQEKLKEGPLEITKRAYSKPSCKLTLSSYSGEKVNPFALRDTNELSLEELAGRTLCYYGTDDYVPFALFSPPILGRILTPKEVQEIQTYKPTADEWQGNAGWRTRLAEKYGISVRKVTNIRTGYRLNKQKAIKAKVCSDNVGYAKS